MGHSRRGKEEGRAHGVGIVAGAGRLAGLDLADDLEVLLGEHDLAIVLLIVDCAPVPGAERGEYQQTSGDKKKEKNKTRSH